MDAGRTRISPRFGDPALIEAFREMNEWAIEHFDSLLPLACAWAEEQERYILSAGVALSAAQMDDARRVGVTAPQRVRLLRVTEIPTPSDPVLAAAAQATNLISPFTAGLTLRYGIFIRDECWGDRRLVAHESAHTMQYERLGGFTPFLAQYLRECITVGYPEAPMEQEARKLEREVED